MENIIFKFTQFFPMTVKAFLIHGIPYLIEDEMTPEITEFILKGQNAFLTLERELDKEELIIIGSVLEEIQTLNTIYYNDKGSLAYFISFLYTIFYSIPVLIVRRLFMYYSRPIFKSEESYKIDKQKNGTKEMVAHIKQREKYNSLKDQYSSNRKEKVNKAESINNLRKYLYINKLRLEGTIKDSSFTFGKEMDNLLKNIIVNYSNIKNPQLLESKLKEIYQEDIRVIIR